MPLCLCVSFASSSSCWPARLLVADEKADRIARSPQQVAEQLAAVYGQKLDQVAYIPALPLVAKLRLSELTGDAKYRRGSRQDRRAVPCGEKSPRPQVRQRAGGPPDLRGAGRCGRKARTANAGSHCAESAADQIFDKDGKPLPLMPFHNEMSDAVFMAGPILAATGKLTGEREVLRRRRHALRLDAQAVPAARRHLSAFAAVRGRLGARQRLSGARPGAGP